MNLLTKNPLLVTCLLCLWVLFSCTTQKTVAGSENATGASMKTTAPETVVYLVRHAEKAASSGAMTDDPALSDAGLARAMVLRDQMSAVPVAALYATKYQRTQQTLQPLAQARNLTVQTYDPANSKALAETIKQNQAGKTVVVAGHSNTVLPLIEALGGKKPIAEITDSQYDYLFKVTLKEGQEPRVAVTKYGTPSAGN